MERMDAVVVLCLIVVTSGLLLFFIYRYRRRSRVTPPLAGKEEDNAGTTGELSVIVMTTPTSSRMQESGSTKPSSIASKSAILEANRSKRLQSLVGRIQDFTRPEPKSGTVSPTCPIEPIGMMRPQQEQILHHLSNLSLFQDLLDIEELLRMAGGCKICSYEMGDHIVHEGDPGDSMYIVKEGHVSVTRGSDAGDAVSCKTRSHVELARLGQQEFFGEMSLLIGKRRCATVTCLTPVECIEIPKEAMFGVLISAPQIVQNIAQLISSRRLPHSRSHQHMDDLADDIERHFQMRKIFELVRKIPVFEGLVDNDELIRSTASRCELQRFDEGDVIVTEGEIDPSGSMYIIESGTVSVLERKQSFSPGGEAQRLEPLELARLGHGDTFGEMSLILGEPRAATIVALGRCDCIRLPKQALLPVLLSDPNIGIKLASLILQRKTRHSSAERIGGNCEDYLGGDVTELSRKIVARFDLEDIMALLRTVPIFHELAQQDDLLRTMASHCCFESIASGKYVVSQDQEGSSLFVVQSGTLRVEINQDGAKRQLAFFGKGDFFGEMSLLTGEPRTASVITTSDCQVIGIPRTALRPILVAWPTLTLNMARVVTERQKETSSSAQLATHDLASLCASIDRHFDADSQMKLFLSLGIFAPILKDEGLVRLLVSKCKLVTFQPGACIVRQHDKTDASMYIIKSGGALVFSESSGRGKGILKTTTAARRSSDSSHGATSAAATGSPKRTGRAWSLGAEKGPQVVKVASLYEGDFFGEMSLLTGEPRCASVSSLTVK